jgi:UDP-galactopyranose mutase
MPIDELFGFRFGELLYRSIPFHSRNQQIGPPVGWSVTNYTDDGPFTRETTWHALPAHHVTPGTQVTVTVEEPCDYRDNDLERYYPVKTADDRFAGLYKQYMALSDAMH